MTSWTVALKRALPLSAIACGASITAGLKQVLGPLDQWAAAHLPALCPVRAVTGLPCPTCGLGRGLLAAMGGDFPGAYTHHPLAPALLVFLASMAALHASAPARARALLSGLGAAPTRHPRATWLLLALYVGWGASRVF